MKRIHFAITFFLFGQSTSFAGAEATAILVHGAGKNIEISMGARRVSVPRELLATHLRESLVLHTWFFDNRREEAVFRSIDGGKKMNVAIAVARRALRERAKGISAVEFFQSSDEKQRLQSIVSKLDSTAATQDKLPEINSAITHLVDKFLNSKNSSSTAVGTIPYAILRSYFRDPPKFEMVKIPDRNLSLQATEVTQREWFVVMGTNPSFFSDRSDCVEDHEILQGIEICPSLPVETFRLAELEVFLQKLVRDSKLKFRLPDNAEWEAGARAGSATKFSYGDSPPEMADFGWSHQNAGGHSHPVRRKKANRWGLYDMHGNVWEIVRDARKYPNEREKGFTIRGGSWIDAVPVLANNVETRIFESWTCYDVGFRLAQ